MKLSFLAIVFLLLQWHCYAQESPTPTEGKTKKELRKERRSHRTRYYMLGISSNTFNWQDHAMSEVRYEGGSVGLNFGLWKESPKHISRLDIQPSIGALQSEYFNKDIHTATTHYRLDFDYHYLRKVKKLSLFGWEKPVEWYLGGQLNSATGVVLHPGLGNSAYGFYSFNSLGLATAFRKEVTVRNKKCQLYYQASLPILSLVARPTFNNVFNFVDPDTDPLGDNIETHGGASWGSLTRFANRFEFMYPIRGELNQLKLGYQWDFYKYNKVHKMVVGRHQLSISLLSYF